MSIKTPLHPAYKDPRKLFPKKYVTWIVDKTLLEGTFSEKLPQVIKDNGYRLITFSGNPNSYDLMDLPHGWMDEGSGPVIAYGCHRFIRDSHQMPWYPGAYPGQGAETHNLYPTIYMVKYPAGAFLNENYVYAPIKQVIRDYEFFYKIFNTDQLFVKDVEAFKRFSAKVLKREEIADYLSLYADTHHIDDQSLVLIGGIKNIFSEHRFVIVNSKVIAHSTYRYAGITDIRIDVPKEALDFATEMAKIWSPCACYTMDIAMSDGKPKILELNSFSCAGLYACDLDSVVNEVSKQVREDYFNSVYPD